jgi:hypothetical protein
VPSNSEENEMNKIRRVQLGFAALVLAAGLIPAAAQAQQPATPPSDQPATQPADAAG